MKNQNKTNIKNNNSGEIIIYTGADGVPNIEVSIHGETVWLSQKHIAELFDCSVDNVSLHMKNIFKEGELEEHSVTEEYSTTASDGKNYLVKHYNLDAIISVGYRVNSLQSTRFRIWATQKLKEYIVKGFVMDDNRLKNNGGGLYWKELLSRIRDIRSSEKMLYRQVLDLYATSADYDPKSLYSIEFFKIVQNKLHYAVHKETAAEVIFNRADSNKEFVERAYLENFKLLEKKMKKKIDDKNQ